MTNTVTVSIGKMPGRLDTYALEGSATIRQALATANLTVGDFEVKADGNVVTNLDQTIAGVNTILLTAKVKGNAGVTVSIGKMPGRLDTYALDSSVSIKQALATANLTVGDFEVKADGNVVTDLNQSIAGVNTILLTAKVKGNVNTTVSIGKMPGRLDTYALDSSSTIKEALSVANLTVGDFEVKADGNVVTNLEQTIAGVNTILLTAKVKGNN